jgi:hypothetical protein
MTNPQLERQQVTIRFADLRHLATAIPPYLAQKVGVAATPALSTAIEDDFRMAGLDTESFLLLFWGD